MSGTLLVSAVPMGLAGWLVQDEVSLYLIRFFIGFAGSAFTACQYSTSSMFAVEIAGTANALVAGWGNVAGGVCQIVMAALLFPLFKIIFGGQGYDKGSKMVEDSADIADEEYVQDEAAESAWRTILVFPALASLIMAWAVVRYGDDTPKGNVSYRRHHNLVEPVSLSKSFQTICALWMLFWSRNHHDTGCRFILSR